MKKLKTLISVMLCAMLVLSLVVPAMADGEEIKYEITINGASDEAEYTAYKVFDYIASAPDNKTGVYVASDALYQKIKDIDGVTSEGFVNGYNKDDGHYVSIEDNADTVKALISTLKNNKGLITMVETKNPTGGTVYFNVTDEGAGYYFVDTTAGTLCILNTTFPNITVNDKNTDVTVEKVLKDAEGDDFSDELTENNAQIGDTVYFQTTITIPEGSKDVVLFDKMDEGFTLNKDSIEVSVANSNFTLDTEATTNYTFKILFKQEFLDTIGDGLAGDNKEEYREVTVTYSAVLNEKAVIKSQGQGKNKNTTWATYGGGQNTGEDYTETSTYDFNLFKYATGNKAEPLPGAQFELYLVEGETQTKVNLILEGNNYRVAKKDEQGLTIINAGSVNIKGLDTDCTYILKETKAPDGYNKHQGDIDVLLAATTQTVEVENKAGAELPSTGGTGTKILFTVGGIMMVVAFVLFTSKRRMAAED